jgi:hypothetical protein
MPLARDNVTMCCHAIPAPCRAGRVARIDRTGTFTRIRKSRVTLWVAAVISRRVFTVLVGGLAVLVVAFAVLMAFYLLISALGDAAASRAILWTAVGCLVFLVADLVLLVGALGLQSLVGEDRGPDRGAGD